MKIFNLITSAKPRLPCKVTFSWVAETQSGQLWGQLIQPGTLPTSSYQLMYLHCYGDCKTNQVDSFPPYTLLPIAKVFTKCRSGYNTNTHTHKQTLKIFQDFPGGAVVKNPPANAGNKGSTPGLGRSHMLWSNQACEPQLLSSHTTTTEAHVP